jgi:putative SOS response-associated peptidase YedK
MRFGLVPFGKDPANQKRSLTNTRVENLGKWPWKSSIKSYRCVVPMTGFREPCYWGETAGTEVDFNIEVDRPILAAAVYTWYGTSSPQSDDQGSERNVDTKKPNLSMRPVFSMSLIMRPALAIVMEHGHHRSPFFLSEDGLDEWLDRKPKPLEQSLKTLQSYATEPKLTATVAREMAATWVKRQPEHLTKRDEQLAAIDATGPLGIPE